MQDDAEDWQGTEEIGMATTSVVKAGLDDISAALRAERAACKQAKNRIAAARTAIANLNTTFADLFATIDAFDEETTDVFEQLAQAEKALLLTEGTALYGDMNTANTALQALTEF